MNNSLELLKSIYKPYRYTFLKNVLILNTTSGDFLVKEKKTDKNMNELFSYLASRNFNNYPTLVDNSRSEINIYEYINSINMPLEQKAIDMIDLLANLHNKTTFYKNVTEDNFKEIYENIKSNIDHLNYYYNELYEKVKNEVYMSPSNYAFIRNSYKIFSALDFTKEELDKWYELVKNQTKKRVCLIHNNPSLEHFLKNDRDYLISWENSRIDSPVMDLFIFYQKEYSNVNFNVLFSRYLESVKLSDDEKKLFFILISLPPKIEFDRTEIKDCANVRNAIDYIFKSEELVRPYYSIEQEN